MGRPLINWRRSPMRKASVVLVAMPWHALSLPSLQLTLLQAVLERAGIRTEVFTLPLTFMQHCCDETADLPESEQIGIADYAAVVRECDRVGLGDWIFAVPPFRDPQEPDAQYLAFVAKRGCPKGRPEGVDVAPPRAGFPRALLRRDPGFRRPRRRLHVEFQPERRVARARQMLSSAIRRSRSCSAAPTATGRWARRFTGRFPGSMSSSAEKPRVVLPT